jgi:pyruvate ferredoxin oxidoreductase beta subunit
MAIVFKDLPDEELIYGQKSCQGCAALLAARLTMKVLGKKTMLACPACCFAATTSVYPESAVFVPNVVTAFPALASTLSGMAVGGEAMGLDDDVTYLGIGGDGGTVDIGLQALSGAAERNENILYICYDNEAYMNTGVQRSGATPYGASTTTTPAGICSKGCDNTFKKSLFEIMAAHRVPYIATASTSYPKDFMEKVAKAKAKKGTKIIHVMAPCPTGWGYSGEKTIEIGKMAVECGLWYLAEYEDGKYKLNMDPKEFKPVETYLKAQKRFKHLKEEDFKRIEGYRDADWERLHRLVQM